MENGSLKAEEIKQIESNAKIRGLCLGALIGMAVMFLIFGGYILIMRYPSTAKGAGIIGNGEIKKINEIVKKIDKNFYSYSDETGTDNLTEGIYRGILASLNDPYSEYYSAEELKAELNDSEGISYGIGCYVSIDKEMNMPMIAGVMEGSPAEKAGIHDGDIIYMVDGESTMGMTLTKVVSLIKGLEGTNVHITIYREGEPDYLEMDITRGELIETNTVTYGTLLDNEDIGYLKISEFSDVTLDQYLEGMAELQSEGIKGLILDLRSNHGGNLDTCVDIARRILPKGIVVYTEDKNGKRINYECDGKHELDMPIVVLTNEYTASAAEILAGAIQDHEKGTLVGTTTFGKGIVQRIMSLSDKSAIKLTISAYFTPSGRNIQGTGIEPDVEIEYDYDRAVDTGDDNQVEKGVEILRPLIDGK
ncbi:MAG: S41 family peptidase [Lachnospiraceae bacterium]|nr:S41 family peptidase [Lachnospiraceae bacterium]